MDKEKQIEEMAKDFCAIKELVICEECHLYKNRCHAKKYATRACNAGYRKSSEVAREIFEEIEKKVKASLTVHLEEINKEHIKDTPLYDRHSGIVFALTGMGDFIAELKKKYMEEGK